MQPGRSPNPNVVFRIGSVSMGVMGQVVLGVGLGYWVDQKLGTFFMTPVGLTLGMILATVTLIRYAKKWTPEAKRSAKDRKD